MKSNICTVVFLLALLVFSMPSTAEDPSSATWLHGKWELSLDPDGSEKDFLTFSKDGAVISSLPGAPDIKGTYTIVGERLTIVFKKGDLKRETEMKISEQRNKLLLHSKRTGNTSEYRKVP